MSELFQFPEVIVVEASAGSGKTYTLAKRYVQLALFLTEQQNIPIQSILAITFTNKATLEMKSRILDFLKRIALKQLQPYEAQDILLPLGISEEKASILAFSLMEDVIHQYHYFQVQTIDSFIKTLLAGCSFKIGLSARFKIQRNSSDYLQLAMDELLNLAHENKKIYELFERFIRQYLFLENRWGWFPKEDLLNVMKVLFRHYNTYQKPLRAYYSSEDLFTKKKSIYVLIQKIKDLYPPETNKRFVNHIEGFLRNNEEIFDVDALKPYWAQEEFPINKGGVCSSEVNQIWQRLRQEICELCWLESHTMFNPYINLFQALLDHFYQLSQKDDVLFLEELNRKAAELFDNELVTVEELYFRLSARFRHYLIDEFQDTSLVQWRNLASMVEEALSGDGSLFYVGDKKQAIYAFRGGESRLFDALQKQLIEYVQIQNLDKNYRSFEKIIEFNNCVFNPTNLKDFLQRKSDDDEQNKRNSLHFNEEDFAHIVNTFGHVQQSPGKNLRGGVVRVSHLSGRTKLAFTVDARERLLRLIKELILRFELKDIAILTRGNEELGEITQWLLHEGIPAQSERNSDIKNNSLVKELVAFLRFLNSPIDNNAFAEFALGELLPKVSGLSCDIIMSFLFDAARKKDVNRDLYFYKEFRDQFPEVWEKFFEPFFRQVGIYPLYELTAGILAQFNCERLFPQYQGFTIHFLQLIKSREEQSCDLAAFLEYYENLEDQERYVPMPQAQAVNILTVHKAKGLEFPVVIIPFLEMDIKVGTGGRDGAQSYVLDIKNEGIELVRLKESYRTFCPELQTLYENEYKKAFLLELNTIYVALTRAVEELYIFIPERCGNSINPARFLIPEECFGIGTPMDRQPSITRTLEKHQKIVTFIDEEWFPKLKEEFLVESAVSMQAAKQGEKDHELLSLIGNLSISSSLNIEKIYLTRIKSITDANELQKFFYLPDETVVYCEKEFVNDFGDTKRIDRLIVFPDKVWVIDYKTSHGGQEYHKKQIRDYVELMRFFYPNHKIEGFVIYLDTISAESL